MAKPDLHHVERLILLLETRGFSSNGQDIKKLVSSDQHMKQTEFVRVGQWVSKTPFNPPAIPLLSVARSSTDIQNEENNLGSTAGRSFEDASTGTECETVPTAPLEPSTPGVTVLSRSEQPVLDRDYYALEWFRILLGMITITTTQIVFMLIVRLVVFLEAGDSSYNNPFANIYIIMIQDFVFEAEVSVAFAAIFVILTQYHQRAGDFIQKVLRIFRGYQQISLRFLAYMGPCSVFIILAVKASTGLGFRRFPGIAMIPEYFVFIP